MATIQIHDDIKKAIDDGRLNPLEGYKLQTLRKKAVSLERKISTMKSKMLPLEDELTNVNDQIDEIETLCAEGVPEHSQNT